MPTKAPKMQITCHLLSLNQAAHIPHEYCEVHFPLRTERAQKFLHEEDRLRCLGAGYLLSHILNVQEDALCFGPFGKPFVPTAPFAFNLSHSGDYILLAVSNTPDTQLGADIEAYNPSHLNVAKRVFTHAEQRWMQEDPAPRFFQLWTAKESVMKACGKGLNLSPESFEVLEALNGAPLHLDQSDWYIQTSSICRSDQTANVTSVAYNHAIAVCTPYPSEKIITNCHEVRS